MVLLVVVHKTPPGLVDGQVFLLRVVQHVVVILPRQLGLNLDDLAHLLRLTYGARVGPPAVATALAQTGLDAAVPGLEEEKKRIDTGSENTC